MSKRTRLGASGDKSNDYYQEVVAKGGKGWSSSSRQLLEIATNAFFWTSTEEPIKHDCIKERWSSSITLVAWFSAPTLHISSMLLFLPFMADLSFPALQFQFKALQKTYKHDWHGWLMVGSLGLVQPRNCCKEKWYTYSHSHTFTFHSWIRIYSWFSLPHLKEFTFKKCIWTIERLKGYIFSFIPQFVYNTKCAIYL